MADEKLNTGPEEQKTPEAAGPAVAEPAQAPAPEQAAAPTPKQEQAEPVPPAPGDVVVSFDKINELMGEKRQAARAEVEKAGDTPAKETEAPATEQPAAGGEEPKRPAGAVPRSRKKRSPVTRSR